MAPKKAFLAAERWLSALATAPLCPRSAREHTSKHPKKAALPMAHRRLVRPTPVYSPFSPTLRATPTASSSDEEAALPATRLPPAVRTAAAFPSALWMPTLISSMGHVMTARTPPAQKPAAEMRSRSPLLRPEAREKVVRKRSWMPKRRAVARNCEPSCGHSPLNSALAPSCFTVIFRQSTAPPGARPAILKPVCMRTLMVSKGWPTRAAQTPEMPPAANGTVH
mmetsp:Transcript_26711/g.67912  ORF Transcript_26711/g.67912 Transcript_26711/m.67912 type:complete len:224 (-) Transcript_26711:261-932(-)